MKKLFFVPLILISTGLFAQRFQLGIKGGVNISNFVGSSPNNVDNKAIVGFHAGAMLPLWFGKYIALQPEVLFSSQGAKVNNAGNEGNFRVSYLTIPVLLKGRFDGGFYLEAGPQIGFRVNDNIPASQATVSGWNTDLAVDAGLGYHGAAGFGIGARYCVGLSKVATFNINNTQPKYRNGVAQLFIFFTLFNSQK